MARITPPIRQCDRKGVRPSNVRGVVVTAQDIVRHNIACWYRYSEIIHLRKSRWCTCTCIGFLCTCNCACQQKKIVRGSCNRTSWLTHAYNLSGIRSNNHKMKNLKYEKSEERDGPNGSQQTLQQVSFQKNTPDSVLNVNAYARQIRQCRPWCSRWPDGARA